MKQNQWMACILSAAVAALGMGSVSAFAEDTVAETEALPEVASVEEAVFALGIAEVVPAAEEAVAIADETIVTETTPAAELATETTTTVTAEIAESTELSATETTTDVVLAGEPNAETTTVVTTVSAETLMTTVVTGDQQGSAPLNYYDDVVLMLDISGSMYGEPMDAMKQAAVRICEAFLTNDASTSISIVTFGTSAEYLPYSSDLTELTDYITNLDTAGLTNMHDGMEQVKVILESSSGERKSVIIMADGMPNEGETDYSVDYGYDSEQNAALEYDNANLKTDATVYSIGFFHDNHSASDAEFIRDLASNASYSYIVTETEELEEVFGTIFQQIVTQDGKTEEDAWEDTPTNDTASTPKTADSSGMGLIAGLLALSALGIAVGKRK